MKDSTRRMRPMGIADILDETVELYKTSFVVLVGISAVLYVPYSICTQYLMMKYYPRLDANMNPAQMLPMIGAVVLGLLWVMIVSPFVTGALTYAVSERFLSRKTTVRESFKRVLSLAVLGRILLAVLVSLALTLVIAGVVGGSIAGCVFIGYANTTALFIAIPIAILLSLGAMVGGVYVGLRLTLVNCVIVVELKGAADSFGRAWNLIAGNMGKCLGLLVLSGLVVGIVQSLIQQPTQSMLSMGIIKGTRPPEWLLILHTLIGAVSSTILAPITPIVTILLYYDIRIRKEGFDLELLASELHANSQQTAWAAPSLPQEVTFELPQEQIAPQPQAEQNPPEQSPGP